MILAGLLAQVISRTLLKPLSQLAEGVTAFERGRHDQTLRPDGSLFLAIGDVTGHEIGSALQTAMAKAVCSQSCREGLPLLEMFARLNSIIMIGKASRLFMTFCGGILDPRTHFPQWISAGNP